MAGSLQHCTVIQISSMPDGLVISSVIKLDFNVGLVISSVIKLDFNVSLTYKHAP